MANPAYKICHTKHADKLPLKANEKEKNGSKYFIFYDAVFKKGSTPLRLTSWGMQQQPAICVLYACIMRHRCSRFCRVMTCPLTNCGACALIFQRNQNVFFPFIFHRARRSLRFRFVTHPSIMPSLPYMMDNKLMFGFYFYYLFYFSISWEYF